MLLYQNINFYLEQQGIKKKFLAEKASITENALNLALNGKRRLLADEYVRICLALNVPLDKFINQSVHMPQKSA
ncbi:helix-turn-helix domain-containing protein [Faecalispora jeddahensis]|uniref:helix-turn-helix domain-containing protein n=1 Tax=Faecalispora jeddahensis TaxID=1414721 RepID=UPI001897B0FF|nr:helix-turn-helix transcriptional regulator [Faecalispora jeddahensis]MDU6306664.1 helix-turn-helix transcriptional regulator [Clostridium sp.]MDU6347409.1 helix-turn-helix transcriptional regulator [Clostridium sp.]